MGRAARERSDLQHVQHGDGALVQEAARARLCIHVRRREHRRLLLPRRRAGPLPTHEVRNDVRAPRS